MWGVTAVASLVGSGAAFALVASKSFGKGLFGWHPALLMAGMGLLAPAAALAAQARHASSDASRRYTLLATHGALQTLAVAASVGGFLAIYWDKDERNKAHFTTTHSWAGLAALGSFAGVWAYGAFRSATKGGPTWRDPLHQMGGVAAIALGGTAIALGMASNFALKNFDESSRYGVMLASALTVVAIAVGYLRPPVSTEEDRPKSS